MYIIDKPRDWLCKEAVALFTREPTLNGILGFDPLTLAHDGELVAEVLAQIVPEQVRASVRDFGRAAFDPEGDLFDVLREDALVTAVRDQDPGGAVTSLLFATGLQNVLAYRLTSTLWRQGKGATALALKTWFVRGLGADIMPQATIGRRVWIDHGLGVVIGQTAVIEEDVSLWHGVTLGTNMVDRGDNRHPRIRRGAIIGAGAKLIGPIEIGTEAVVAAGATVVENVPPRSIAVGGKARILEGRARSAAELGIKTGELT